MTSGMAGRRARPGRPRRRRSSRLRRERLARPNLHPFLSSFRERGPKPASGFFMSAAVTAQSLRCGRFRLMLDRPLVAGVVNVTPDSFSDGGNYLEPEAAIAHAQRLVDEGADLVDIGAESSRPGASSVSAEQELSRLMPVLEGLRACPVPISVDTTKPEVMRAVIGAGAAMINDIGAQIGRAHV